jgi:hypothetical protein
MASNSSSAKRAGVVSVDPIWTAVRQEAEEAARKEPALGGFWRTLSAIVWRSG